MATLISVRLNKGDSPSLGFRLQGGKDFGTPLVIQKVNLGSPAERAGLVAGDAVIKINNTDVFNLRHKDAQDVIVKAGPAFEVTVQRGGSTWKPAVIPTGNLHSPGPVTKTSLAAPKGENIGAIGTGHNLAAKPFSPQLNGVANGGPKVVNNQYNSPLKLYSEESIAETLSAQTEVLATGALGVNFQKNEKNYDASNSAVFRMLQEVEKEPKAPEAEPSENVATSGLRHVAAPENRPAPSTPQLPPGQNICADCERLIVGVFVRIKDKNLHVECFKCSTCGTSLKNVGYYNINNKLYCDIHAKLAARSNPSAANLIPVTVPPGGKAPANAISAALSSHSLPSPSPLSPKSNFAQPFQPVLEYSNKEAADLSSNLHNFNITPSQELNITSSPTNSLNNSTPLSFNKFLKKAGNYSAAPKPFSSVVAPSANYNSFPKSSAPLSPISTGPAPSFSPASSAGRFTPAKTAGGSIFKGRSVQNIIWPPPAEEPEVPTACPLYFPPPSQVVIKPPKTLEDMDEVDIIEQFQHPKLSLCSQEVSEFIERRSACECVETLSEVLQRQQLVESVMQNRPPSPPPVPRRDSVLEAAPIILPQQLSEVPQSQVQSGACELKKPTDFKPNTIECELKSQVENAVPKQWESAMVQALRTIPSSDSFTNIPTKRSSSALASALAIAPSEPFSPQTSVFEHVSLPEYTEPYFPTEHSITIEPKEPKPEPPDTQFVKALRTAPERPFTPTSIPVKKKQKDPNEEVLKELPKPDKWLTMREALTTASERPYTPLSVTSEGSSTYKEEEKVEIKNLQKPLKPSTLPDSFQKVSAVKVQAPKPFPVRKVEGKGEIKEVSVRDEEKGFVASCKYEEVATKQEECSRSTTVEETVSHEQGETYQGMYPLFKGFSCSFGNKSEHSQFQIEINTSSPIINVPSTTTTQSNVKVTSEDTQQVKETKMIAKQAEEVVLKKPLPLATALHKPQGLPQYQVNLSENAEADLKLLERIEAAKLKHDQQKTHETIQPKLGPLQQKPEVSAQIQTKKPVIVIQGGNAQQQSFKPVCEDFRPPSSTFSPRPRSLTPSMINKPPPTIPYYQANLVAQHYQPAMASLFDPASPSVSRTPSPCPDRIPSPFSKKDIRPKSPAEGPPPNPLKSNVPLPDPKIEQAKKSLGSFIPHHKQKLGGLNLPPNLEVQNQTATPQSAVPVPSLKVEAGGRIEGYSEHHKETLGTLEIDVKAEQTFESYGQRAESEIIQNDGLVQIQRKQVVTEEFEHNQKKIEVQKTKHAFKEVNNPQVEVQGIIGLHVTNPQKITSPFLNKTPVKHVVAPSTSCPIKHVPAASAKKPSGLVNKPVPVPNVGSAGGRQSGAVGVAPKRGRGILNTSALGGARVPLCACCHSQIRGPFITALGKIWCPDHFICATPSCKRPLQDLGFVEERGQLYCEYCFEQYLAPPCSKCAGKIKGDCLKAIGKNFHPECFNCVYCGKHFGNNPFFLEDGNPYCEADWNELFTTKCFACGFPVEAGDRWVEALNNNYHSQCFNCTMCKKNLEGQSFVAKGGRPFCKNHAR